MDTKKKKSSQKALYTLMGFLLVFASFIYILMKPSAEALALDDLQKSLNIEEVRSSYEKHRSELSNDNDYIDSVRTRLASFHLSQQQTEDCLKWLPRPAQSLNLIIVPDLSGRINDEVNNPAQTQNDTILLNEVWRSFLSATKSKMNSSDRLLVDVTGGNQAKGQFRLIADDLLFDLSANKNKSNKLYYAKTGNRFQKKVSELYDLAKQEPLGADYWSYFNHDLKSKLKTSNLFTEYRNLLIILTDGYLEAQNKETTGIALYTGSYQQRTEAFNKLKAGLTINDAMANINPIMDCTDHFKDLEVLILEVHARHALSRQEPKDPGTPRDFDILKKLWTDWFKKLEIKNASVDFFNERLNATDLTKQRIRDFIKGNN